MLKTVHYQHTGYITDCQSIPARDFLNGFLVTFRNHHTLMKPTGETFSTDITLFVNATIISGDPIHPWLILKAWPNC